MRSYDVTVRWGGDEFVCALSEVTLEVAPGVVPKVTINHAQELALVQRLGVSEADTATMVAPLEEGFCRKFSFGTVCGMISLHDHR